MYSNFLISKSPPHPQFSPFDEIRVLQMQLQSVNNLVKHERLRHAVEVQAYQEELVALRHEAASLREKLKVSLKKTEEMKPPIKFNQSKQTFWKLSRSARFKRKSKVLEFLKQALKKLPDEFKPVEIKFQVSEKELILPLGSDNEEEEDSGDEEVSDNLTRRVLAAKDRGFISDEAFHELRMALPVELRESFPSLNKIKKERKGQNGVLEIQPITEAKGGDGGRKKIEDILRYLLDIPAIRHAIDQSSGIIRARFAADGRKTSAKIGSVMAVLSLLDENCNTVDYQYTIALYNGKEDYEELQSCLGPTFKEIHFLAEKGLDINGKQYHVEWVCCCDWKFLSLVYGLNAACSFYFCIWCYCTKDLISCLDIEDWPILRTIENCVGNHTKNGSEKKGCIRKPLLDIPFTSVVADTLHMFLRIMGLLFGQIIDKVVNEDKKEQLVNEMDRIGIPFKFYDVRDGNSGDGETKFTKLDGKDLRKVLKTLDVKKVLEGIVSVNAEQVEMLWKGFQVLLNSISTNHGDDDYLDPDTFKKRAREWGHLYLYINYPEDLTPYIHALIYHVPQFMAKYNSIKQFSCQPVEKKNHIQNQVFHRASQKGGRGSKYTVQILERENRSLFAKRYDLTREKRVYRMSNGDEQDKEEITAEDCFEGVSTYDKNQSEEG